VVPQLQPLEAPVSHNRWLPEIRGGTEFLWCRDRAHEEMERPELHVGLPRPEPDTTTSH
jgi:hypothetical protein